MAEVFIRTSERSTFMRCPQKWEWSYLQRLKPNYTSPPLRFGSLVHDALAEYYRPNKTAAIKRGPHPAKTFDRLYVAQLEAGMSEFGMVDESEVWVDARGLGNAMLTNYIERYGKDQRYRIIAPELPFQIDIVDPETGEYLCTYVGTFDAVIEDLETAEIGLFEHKTAASISTGHLPLDEQASSYWAYAPDWLRSQGILRPDQDLDFILYNFLRKSEKDDRPENELGQKLNQNGSVSKKQPPPLFHRERVYRGTQDRISLMWRVIHQAREMEMYRDGRLTIYKRPMNGCVGMLGCEFRDMCEVHETGSDWEAIRDSMFHEWEPYEAHDEKGGE